VQTTRNMKEEILNVDVLRMLLIRERYQ